MRRYDYEFQVPAAVVAYLQAQLDAEIQAGAPVVTWFDPMAIDDASRIIVLSQSATPDPAQHGNSIVPVQVVVRSRWAQASVSADLESHFERVNDVRDKLLASGLAASLHDAISDTIGIGIYAVGGFELTSSIKTEGWAVSETNFNVSAFSSDTPDNPT